jgi:hypothetical protein
MNRSSRRFSEPSARARTTRAIRACVAAACGAAALLSLSGCYYYPPAYGYSPAPYYATAPAAYPAYPAYPAYSAYPAYYPAYPAYAYPSVSFGIGGYWGGHGHHH